MYPAQPASRRSEFVPQPLRTHEGEGVLCEAVEERTSALDGRLLGPISSVTYRLGVESIGTLGGRVTSYASTQREVVLIADRKIYHGQRRGSRWHVVQVRLRRKYEHVAPLLCDRRLRVATVGQDRQLRLWEVGTHQRLYKTKIAGKKPIHALVASRSQVALHVTDSLHLFEAVGNMLQSRGQLSLRDPQVCLDPTPFLTVGAQGQILAWKASGAGTGITDAVDMRWVEVTPRFEIEDSTPLERGLFLSERDQVTACVDGDNIVWALDVEPSEPYWPAMGRRGGKDAGCCTIL